MREMTDSEIKGQVERTDAFIASLRHAIDEAVADLDPHSPCIDQARAGLKRISATLDDVDYVLLANLSAIDAALTRRTGCGLLPIIEVHLMAVGSGPTLDHATATQFLSPFTDIVETVRRRKIN